MSRTSPDRRDGHATVLVVEDDQTLREALCDTLDLAGYRVVAAADARTALDILRRETISMVVTDVQMPEMDGHALLQQIKADRPQLPVLLMTAYGTVKNAVAAMRDGASDYLVKPFEAEVLINMVARYVLPPASADAEIIAVDERSRTLVELADRVAGSDVTVMITGESGTGKEVLARYIHRRSRRATQPFVAINCAAIPENMLEAMLFGYEKGAFTGASQASPGKFEQAQGGTLLLDEISEMDLALQAKLLRVLQEREVERLGGRKPITLDVRVLATSNRMMRDEVVAGRFREDLYYRLNVFPLQLPPLRDRTEDIVPMAQRLLAVNAGIQGINIPVLSDEAQRHLLTHFWPGNVRELDNLMQRALIMQRGDTIDVADLPLEVMPVGVRRQASANTAPPAPLAASAEGNEALGDDLRSHERNLIMDALKTGLGSRKAAAERLGISPRTLRYKLARLREQGIEIPG